jgi:hypothetical protein
VSELNLGFSGNIHCSKVIAVLGKSAGSVLFSLRKFTGNYSEHLKTRRLGFQMVFYHSKTRPEMKSTKFDCFIQKKIFKTF